MNSNPFTSKNLFISRKISAESVFNQLRNKGWKIFDQSLLNIKYIQIDNIPNCDWIFFYSPNGVKAFAQNVEKLNFNTSTVKIAAYGPGTSDVIQSYNWQIDFIGTGESEGTLEKFNSIALDSKVLFPMALHSKHALLSTENYTFSPINLVVYENSMNPIDLPVCDAYIFTSSLNVISFFEANIIPDEARVIAIGKSTANTLLGYYTGEINIPSAPTELDLFELIK